MSTKLCTFNHFFNYDCKPDRDNKWASTTREQALEYLKRLFTNKSQFSCVARTEKPKVLMLKGHCNLNNPVSLKWMKRVLGKCSSVKPSYFGDVVNLACLAHLDPDILLIGRLPCASNGSKCNNLKTFSGDPQLVAKVLTDSMKSTNETKPTTKNETTEYTCIN